MKKLSIITALAIALAACTNDDRYSWDESFADRTATDTITIAISYDGDHVTVTGDAYGYVSATGASVTVTSQTNKFLQLLLSGQTTNGSLLIYSWKKVGVVLNGVSIKNPTGPAINNQCSKAFYVTLAPGTVNSLSDGDTYAQAPVVASGDTISQKGTLFSEGQIFFQGTGSLTVAANAKNGIASDDYLTFESGNISVTASATASNGVKANDGVFIHGGTLSISVAANGARGIKNDARMEMTGGTATITTTGDCRIDTLLADDGSMAIDTTSCAGIRCDSLFTLSGGTLTILSSGDGGKGINCSQNFEQRGGTLSVTTKGSKLLAKPKGVKSDTEVIVSGGTFDSQTRKSKACDSGGSDWPTVIGTPQYTNLDEYDSKHVRIVF